jgi:2-polyprenyl-3-methyl-5-hydroxy-6-metoxy-1,4-benzoquinol methylase
MNSGNFHFDTEIIIQLLTARQRIVELPIPTHYGDEVCYVDGVRYAKDVMLTTFQLVAHRHGVFNQRRFEPAAGAGNSHYDVKLGYPSSHQFALDAVPAGSRVLDIGAGPGRMASELVAKGCEVTVVDQFPAPDAPTDVEVIQQDLDDPPVFDARKYDHLLMLDVIEHLKDPEVFLEQLVDQFDFGPRTLVLTTPNVAFVAQRLMLLGGQFNYGNAGILDRTHTRLFTFRSLRRLLVDSGFHLREVRGVPAPWPKVLGDGALGRAAIRVNEQLIRLSRTLFSYQIFVVADCTPNVRFVLEDSRSRSEAPRE